MSRFADDCRNCMRRVLTVAAAAAALTASAGCATAPRGPAIAAPAAPARFGAFESPVRALERPARQLLLREVEPRAAGPLRAASEAEVQVVRKPVPFGTITVEAVTVDGDSMVRVSDGDRTTDRRVTTHEGIVKRTQLLGRTREGLVRMRIDYLNSSTISGVRGRPIMKTHPVHGKSYIVDVAPRRVHVFTLDGLTPPPDEVAFVLRAYSGLLHGPEPSEEPSQDSARGRPPSASESVAAAIREQFAGTAIEVKAVHASLKGIQDIDGVPCAVFDLKVQTRRHGTERDPGSSSEMNLTGEYAFRLDTGWEAEILLQGTTAVEQRGDLDGAATATSKGLIRIHTRTRYRAPAASPDATFESVRRSAQGASGT